MALGDPYHHVNLPWSESPTKTEPETPAQDLTIIESALYTVAESIKYLADTYREINEEKSTKMRDLKPVPQWRKAQVGDWVKLTGGGSTDAAKYAGSLVKVVDVNNGMMWMRPDGTISPSWINHGQSRYTVWE